jgi:hypothetical protein
MQVNRRISLVLVAILLLTLSALGVTAQDDPALAFAAVQNGQPTVFGLGDAPLVIDTIANRGISNLTWSPDGNLLAYTLNDEQFQAHVYVADVTTGAAPIMLNTGPLVSEFPITFSADSQLIYIAQSEAVDDPTTPYQADVKRIAPLADAQPETLATFGYQVGCGSSEFAPPSWKYWEEAGYAGSALVVKMTDFGLLHSANCYGFGLAMLNLQTSENTLIDSQFMFTDGKLTEGPLGRVALSPDGKTAAAVRSFFTGTEVGLPRTYSLALIDLATLTITDVPTVSQPDQLTWSKDGSTLFYSVQENPVNIAANLTPEQLATVAPIVGYENDGQTVRVLTYTASIHQLNPATGENTLVYSADAYAIGRMAAAPDGQHLIASHVASPESWMAALGSQQSALVPVTLYKIPLLTREAPLMIGENLTQFVLRPTRQ